MKLKVCGMKHNPGAIARLHPDYLGFIFWEPSPRNFGGPPPEGLSKGPVPAGVFVDATADAILEKCQDFGLGMVQLHGKESAAFCGHLKNRLEDLGLDVLLVKAFAVGPGFDFEALQPYLQACDAFLFDSRGPMPGGNGKAFDWTLLAAYPFDLPYFLSGGIGPESVPELEAFFQQPAARRCMAIDINSGFETRPGEKDPARIKTFMNQAFWTTKRGLKSTEKNE